MILIADNFSYQARKPLDARIVLDTIADMVALTESTIYEGILVYNKETKKYYQFDPSNSNDVTLGKWREFSGGSGGNASIIEYAQDTQYTKNTLIIKNNKLYIATLDFTSSNLGPTIEEDFALDLASNNLIAVSAEQEPVILEYKQNTSYKKDTLIYSGDRLGRVTADFTSDQSKPNVDESLTEDIKNGNIIVDNIDISELDEQLLKALPIVAFVTKKDIPRFESQMTIDGSVPTFRDGTALSDTEKKGCNFFYIIDANGELTGLAIITNYDETADEFTVNAMKYGVGTSDNILPADGILTKRTVGELQIVYKDDLLNPRIVIKDSAPIDTTSLWYQSNKLDSSDITVGSITVKKYNNTTSAWDLTETIDIKDSDVVKNGNGGEWEYYRIQSNGNVFISLANWQLVYDTAQILGKIIDINTTTHEVTIKTIHANPEADSYLTEDVQANIAIGAAPANFLYKEGMTFTEFVKKIAIKDILATIAFSATGSGIIKKGTIINGTTLTVNITNVGNIPIKKIKFMVGNTQLSEQNYVDGTNTYTETYSISITTDTTFSVILEQDKNYTTTKQAKFTFVNPSYIGTVNTISPSETDILALTEKLKDKKDLTHVISMFDSRTCYAYPKSLGQLTTIKDKNNFEYINSFTRTTMTINSEDYYVYILTDAVTAVNFTWYFN